MSNVPTDTNVGIANYWLLEEGFVAGSSKNSINAFFDPTGGLPVAPALYDRYVSQATANGWIINNIYYWNGNTWSDGLPVTGQTIYVAGGALYPTRFIYYTGAAWAPVPNGTGNVTGPGASTDRSLVRWNGAGGTDLFNSVATLNDTGSINLPIGQSYNINGEVAVSLTGGNSTIGTSLPALTTGQNNVALTQGALLAVTSGSNNVGIGSNAGKSINVGNFNVLIGESSGLGITSGSNNIALGTGALIALTTGSNNVAIGNGAGNLITTGSGNVAVGNAASVAAGINNATAIGAGASATTANTVVLGSATATVTVPGTMDLPAGKSYLIGGGIASSLIGSNCCLGTTLTNLIAGTNFNIAIGSAALFNVTNGDSNIGLGRAAAQALMTGSYNIIIGYSNGGALSAGSNNILIGSNSQSIVDSTSAILIGNSAGVGDNSIAIGNNSDAQENYAIAIGFNTRVGNAVLSPDGIAIGSGSIVNGSKGVALGSLATVASGHNFSTAIGFSATTTSSNQIMLGNSTETVTFPGKALFTDTTSTTTNLLTINYFAAVPTGAAADGSLAVGFDGANYRLYVRAAGAWKSVVVA